QQLRQHAVVVRGQAGRQRQRRRRRRRLLQRPLRAVPLPQRARGEARRPPAGRAHLQHVEGGRGVGVDGAPLDPPPDRGRREILHLRPRRLRGGAPARSERCDASHADKVRTARARRSYARPVPTVPLLLLLAAAPMPPPSPSPSPATPPAFPRSREVVYATHGMVAAAQPLAVQAGLDVLKQGGSAADAAIAANAVLALMEPVACGPGGDLFAILWDPKAKKVIGLNSSGRAPKALTADKVKPDAKGTIPLDSPASWTVPGAVDGWFALHQRYGKLPMKQVLAAAIRYADEGFPVSPVIAEAWGRSAPKLEKYPGFAATFLPGGKAPRAGEIFKNPPLAKTLRLLADKGRDAYYQGPIAQALVKFGQANGGSWTMEDFAASRPTWDEPISTDYHGYTVYELPPPGQGLAALQLLNVLENFDLKSMGRSSPDFWHVMVEAKKVVFADRARYYADPAFAKVPVQQLLSKAYAKRR